MWWAGPPSIRVRTPVLPATGRFPIWTISTSGQYGASGFARGIGHHLLAGAVEFARSHGAPAVEGYPVDNQGKKVDLTMAYVGTRTLFERAGFTKAADTDSVLNGFPRVLMRLNLG
jgi:hypothetical protein